MSKTNAYEPVEVDEEAVVAKVVEEVPLAAIKATALPMIEVVAPATLPEGYTFEAEVGGRVISVTVPNGGVEEGQRFMVPAKQVAGNATSPIPVGSWRDGLCNCCAYGCCHAQFCLTFWCAPCALGQVMQRMNLTWYGEQTSQSVASATCRKVAYMFAAYIACDYLLAFIEMAILPPGNSAAGGNPYATNTSNPEGDIPPVFFFFYFLRGALHAIFLVWMIVAVMNTRRNIRDKYAIREQHCKGGMEDCCCSFWCHSCTICQMARHTADYDTYQARCCSSTGLPPTAPTIV